MIIPIILISISLISFAGWFINASESRRLQRLLDQAHADRWDDYRAAQEYRSKAYRLDIENMRLRHEVNHWRQQAEVAKRMHWEHRQN